MIGDLKKLKKDSTNNFKKIKIHILKKERNDNTI